MENRTGVWQIGSWDDLELWRFITPQLAVILSPVPGGSFEFRAVSVDSTILAEGVIWSASLSEAMDRALAVGTRYVGTRAVTSAVAVSGANAFFEPCEPGQGVQIEMKTFVDPDSEMA